MGGEAPRSNCGIARRKRAGKSGKIAAKTFLLLSSKSDASKSKKHRARRNAAYSRESQAGWEIHFAAVKGERIEIEGTDTTKKYEYLGLIATAFFGIVGVGRCEDCQRRRFSIFF